MGVSQLESLHASTLPAALRSYGFVHLQLYVGLRAEQLVRPRGRERFGAVREQEEIAEEEGPQLPAAFGFVQPTAVQQLARPEAVGERVEDQVLNERGGESEGFPKTMLRVVLEASVCAEFTSIGPSHWTWLCIHSSRSEFSFSLTPSLT